MFPADALIAGCHARLLPGDLDQRDPWRDQMVTYY